MTPTSIGPAAFVGALGSSSPSVAGARREATLRRSDVHDYSLGREIAEVFAEDTLTDLPAGIQILRRPPP